MRPARIAAVAAACAALVVPGSAVAADPGRWIETGYSPAV